MDILTSLSKLLLPAEVFDYFTITSVSEQGDEVELFLEEKAGFDSFQTLAGTIYDRYDEVLNFFNDRSTNASAEAFNSKVKNFRAALRGVSDISFFLFRLQKIYA